MDTSIPIVKDFAIKEYESLRQEGQATVAETRLVERYAVVGSAGFWTWLLSQNHWLAIMEKAKWVPLALCVLAGLRCLALLAALVKIADYTRLVESYWGTKDAFWWERYIAPRRWYLTASAACIWIALIGGNFLVAWWFNAAWFVH